MSQRVSSPPSAARRVRQAGRARNRKKLDLLALAYVTLCIVLVGQCLRVLFTSPRFRLTHVEVVGSDRYSPEQIVQLAGLPLGQNIFHVNLVRVSSALQREPVVEAVTVTRRLPAALRVELRERVPAFQIMSQRAVYLADRDGLVFERVPRINRELPILDLAPRYLPGLGETLRPRIVRSLWECYELAEREALDLRRVQVDGVGEVWLQLNSSSAPEASPKRLTVRVGRPAELSAKFQDIRQAMAGWAGLVDRAAYLNVMCPGRPAYMRRGEEGNPGT